MKRSIPPPPPILSPPKRDLSVLHFEKDLPHAAIEATHTTLLEITLNNLLLLVTLPCTTYSHKTVSSFVMIVDENKQAIKLLQRENS